MKRYGYILIAALLTLVGCHGIDPFPEPVTELDGERVTLSFKVAIPGDGTATRAMGNDPTIDTSGFYIAVFGGSGYFNEWVKATVAAVTPANYDTTAATIYNLTASFSISDSRLRLHFIANCPTAVRTSPPISGGQDTEEYVLSNIRSQLRDSIDRNGTKISVNDAYWQKIILPNGIRVDKVNNTYVATAATMAQFPDPIILVRNFARVYLRNLTPVVGETGSGHQLVSIKAFGLAFAPAEGTVAPLLSAPYMSNEKGDPIFVPDNDSTTRLYYESFFINYHHYPIDGAPGDTILTGAPFNYGGYSPEDQSYDYYPTAGHTDPNRGVPVVADLQPWDSVHPENNVLFVYERTMPSASRRATRVIIQAERVDQNGNSDGIRFYALDIVNSDGVAIPLLRNQTYTVHLLNIEAGSGETDIAKASKATSATVSGDPNYQNLINISDGKSSIGTSFTEKFYVQPQLDSVMFRYIPTNVTDSLYQANREGNELVSLEVGSLDENSGIFTRLNSAEAADQSILAFEQEGDTLYRVWIVKENDKAVLFVRQQNKWVHATNAQVQDSTIEKWSMIKYQLNTSYKDSLDFFTQARTQAIRVTGSYGGRDLSRNIVIKTSPRQTMEVTCRQKYVMESAGQEETVRIKIPKGLSRSVFPLEFTIEPDGYSLTPNGDVLPVTFGASTVPGNDEPAFYFIRSLTQTEYDGLATEGDWKYFDCRFKTTVAQNACTVYVGNKYFNTATSHDEFYNFGQRLFTNLAFSPSSTVYHNGNVTFTFRADYAHSSADSCVWWDPTNKYEHSPNVTVAQEKGLNQNLRVLPPVMRVVLNGLTPQTNEYDQPISALKHISGNIYEFSLPEPPRHNDANNLTLKLKATGSINSAASVVLSTENITECPALYASATSSTITIRGAEFQNETFGGSNVSSSRLALGLNKTVTFRFDYVEGLVVPVTVTLEGLTLDGNTGTNALFTSNGDGTYTFTPTDASVTSYTVNLKTTTRFSPCTVILSQADYETSSTTINRALTFTIPSNALYVRNAAGNGAPTNLTTSTYVYLNNTATYAYKARSYFSNSYLNNSQMTVTLSDYTLTDDDAPVYFIYRTGNNNNNYAYYYAKSTLSSLVDATSSNRETLLFKGVMRVLTPSNSTSITSSPITVSFAQGSGTSSPGYWNNYGVGLYPGNTATFSISSGYKLTSIVIQEYNSGTYSGPFTCNTGSISGLSNYQVTWTAGEGNTTSVVLTSSGGGSNGTNDIDCTSFTVAYEAL